jgi:serine/threonine protein kinase
LTHAAARHECIVQLKAIFEDSFHYFLVMELLDGYTLGQELKVKPNGFGEQEALFIISVTRSHKFYSLSKC